MLTVKGYTVQEKLHAGPNVEVYRGLRLEDNRQVILKLPNHLHPSPKEIAAFQHEYTLLNNLSLPGVIKAYELILQPQPVLVSQVEPYRII